MKRPYVIEYRKKGFKLWKPAGTVHNTRPSAEKYAKSMKTQHKTINQSIETKTKIMPVKHFGQHQEQLRRNREYWKARRKR